MPGLNPFYWLTCGFIVAASLVMAALVGLGAFRGTRFFVRHSRNAYLIALPVGLTASAVACILTFWGLLSLSDFDSSTPVTRPEESDLVGTWTFSAATLADMRTNGGYEITTHSLNLRNDGTFEIVNIPDWWLNFGHSSHGFYSGSGTWSVVKDFQGHWVVEVRFTSLPGYESGLLTSLRIGQSKASYYIYDFIGDPDSGHVMVFERL